MNWSNRGMKMSCMKWKCYFHARKWKSCLLDDFLATEIVMGSWAVHSSMHGILNKENLCAKCSILLHGNFIFMHGNFIFMHENDIFMNGIFMPRLFHAWNLSYIIATGPWIFQVYETRASFVMDSNEYTLRYFPEIILCLELTLDIHLPLGITYHTRRQGKKRPRELSQQTTLFCRVKHIQFTSVSRRDWFHLHQRK